MTATSFFQNPGTQITLKLALIFFLVLFLLIPKFMILDLIEERQKLSESVINEVSAGWGAEQIHTGPALIIPYYHIVANVDKTKPTVKTKTNLIVMPENLKVDGTVTTASKYRSLYKVLLYKAGMKINGSFKIPDSQLTNIKQEDLLLDEAYIIMGVRDPKGINNKIDMQWNNQNLTLHPGMENISFNISPQISSGHTSDFAQNDAPYLSSFKTGLHAKMPIDLNVSEYVFSYQLDIKGSKGLLFAPLGKSTEVHLKSTFTDPVFAGGFLPEHTTDASGFDARWKVLEYNKSLPSFQKDNDIIDLSDNVFGVKIRHLIDNYTKSYRAGKYMILFIILTFLVVFLTEIVEKIRIHIFQYTLIGFALAIFFTLLLSISEFYGFDTAYFVAAIATIGLIFLYSLGMFRHRKSSVLLLALLTTLFGYIYLIIQLEKTALLAGSLGLFVIIALTMYVTRKIKWFEEDASNKTFIEEKNQIN